MKKIRLTQEKFALVDNCDYDYLTQWKWCAHKSWRSIDTFYASRSVWRNGKCKYILMHRVIMQRMGYNWKQVDHINRDSLDNSRKNLRNARNKNAQNASLRQDNRSGYKGVSWNKAQRMWISYIYCNHQWKYLGRYNTAKEAAIVYNKAARKFFKKFAVLNKLKG
jgi:hypothetical protein